jgi:hypothetical protein
MKKITIILIVFFAISSTQLYSQGISVNDNGADADASAMLDVSSSSGDKGFLLPRLTEAQKNLISSPATSLLIYQTDGDAGFYYYNGSSWEPVSKMMDSYATIAAAEAVSGSDNTLCYVIETETYYRYESDAAAYVDDDKYILSTNDGGNTRWLGICGHYNINNILFDEIVHIDASSGSATITELNKIYYVETGSGVSTVTIPDANAQNAGWFLRIYKCEGNGLLNIVTTSGQDIDGASSASIVYQGKGFYIKADMADGAQWLKLQDSRAYVPDVLEITSDYGATDSWAFDYMFANTSSTELTVTFPADISGFPEGSKRFLFNTGSNPLYLDPNGNQIDGISDVKVISPNGYIEVAKINGTVRSIREKNVMVNKEVDEIANLELWLDASQLSGSDGSYVTSWTDLANSTVFSATSGLQPVLKTNSQNGKNVVRFDGSNDVMSAGDIEIHDNSRGLTMIAVVRASQDKRMAILSKYQTTGNNRQYAFGNRDNLLFEDGSWGSYTGALMYMKMDEFQIVEFVWEPGNPFQLYINGVLTGTGHALVNDISDLTANLKLGGGDYSYVGNWAGDIAELMVYSDAVSDSEREALRSNLALKWDVDDIIIANGGGKYWQRDADANTIYPDIADDNLDMGDGTVSASDYQFSDGGSAVRSVRQVVNAGVAVTMDNISVQIPTTGNRNLQLKTVSGSFTGHCSGNYITGGAMSALTTNGVTYNTSYQYLLSSSWHYGLGGDHGVYMINDTDTGKWYKITVQIGDGWNNNLIMIERLF